MFKLKRLYIKALSIFLTLLSFLCVCSCKKIDVEIYMFSNIDECINIENNKKADAIIEKYDSSEKDLNSQGLEYLNFFGCTYSDSEMEFEIFAYEFLDDDTAKAYLKNETGIKTDKNIHFLDSTGMSKSSRIVISDNKAYSVYTKKKDFEKVKEFINNCFSEKISVSTTDNRE